MLSSRPTRMKSEPLPRREPALMVLSVLGLVLLGLCSGHFRHSSLPVPSRTKPATHPSMPLPGSSYFGWVDDDEIIAIHIPALFRKHGITGGFGGGDLGEDELMVSPGDQVRALPLLLQDARRRNYRVGIPEPKMSEIIPGAFTRRSIGLSYGSFLRRVSRATDLGSALRARLTRIAARHYRFVVRLTSLPRPYLGTDGHEQMGHRFELVLGADHRGDLAQMALRVLVWDHGRQVWVDNRGEQVSSAAVRDRIGLNPPPPWISHRHASPSAVTRHLARVLSIGLKSHLVNCKARRTAAGIWSVAIRVRTGPHPSPDERDWYRFIQLSAQDTVGGTYDLDLRWNDTGERRELHERGTAPDWWERACCKLCRDGGSSQAIIWPGSGPTTGSRRWCRWIG